MKQPLNPNHCCSIRCCDYATYVEKEALRNSFTKYEETEAPKCGVAGKEVAACDNGCGHEFEKPVTPDETTDDVCDHLCHKAGFVGFIWKIVQFFWKLFKMNPVCECGAAHY